jgi:hypothetical protein
MYIDRVIERLMAIRIASLLVFYQYEVCTVDMIIDIPSVPYCSSLDLALAGVSKLFKRYMQYTVGAFNVVVELITIRAHDACLALLRRADYKSKSRGLGHM